MLIELKQAVFGYGARPVVRVETLRLEAGRCLGIFGPNGAGKTTLIRGITGLLPPMAAAQSATAPNVTRPAPGGHSNDPHRLGPDNAIPESSPTETDFLGAGKTADLRTDGDRPVRFEQGSLRIGYLPQHRAMELHWPMSGLDAAAMATSARSLFGWLGLGQSRSVLDMMRTLGVEQLANSAFSRLSGGQQQRLLLAGALAADPHILVLDEPTDGLDVQSTHRLLELLRDFISKGLCCVIISHEVEDLLFLANNVAWLHAADMSGGASHVEIISPEGLAQRMLATRAAGRKT